VLAAEGGVSRVRHYDVTLIGSDGVPLTVRVQRNTRAAAIRRAPHMAKERLAPSPFVIISCEYVKED